MIHSMVYHTGYIQISDYLFLLQSDVIASFYITICLLMVTCPCFQFTVQIIFLDKNLSELPKLCVGGHWGTGWDSEDPQSRPHPPAIN